MPSNTNINMSERFDRQYKLGEAAVLRDLERAACGCDYGGTSWTTQAEADELSRLLKLAPDVNHLEIGAGSGWPSLYQAKESGCNATLTDVSSEGLRVAENRAGEEGISDRSRFAVAPCFDLPFDNASFDAIGHSDVLCCVEEKRETLKECRRLIRTSGRMAFSVIYLADGVTRTDIDRAAASGPSLIDAPVSYPEMLQQAGWQIEFQRGVTREFAEAIARHAKEYEARADDLAAIMGKGDYAEALAKLRSKQQYIKDGIVKRCVYCVTPTAKAVN